MKNKMETKEKKKGNLRVWWSSQVPIDNSLEVFVVTNIKEAKNKIDELTNRDLKDALVTDNVGGLEVFNGSEWEEWESEDGENIDKAEGGNQ